jgi:hypothetical protein
MASEGVSFLGRFDRDEYTEERAIELARAYAGESRDDSGRLMSLSALHRADPSWFPPPWVIINWRETVPRFRLLMEQAERTRAFVMMEECIELADDTTRQAAQVRNSMDARFRLAEVMDRRRIGKGSDAAGAVTDESSPDALAALPTEQLMAIAREGRVAVPALGGPVAENGARTEPTRPGGGGG